MTLSSDSPEAGGTQTASVQAPGAPSSAVPSAIPAELQPEAERHLGGDLGCSEVPAGSAAPSSRGEDGPTVVGRPVLEPAESVPQVDASEDFAAWLGAQLDDAARAVGVIPRTISQQRPGEPPAPTGPERGASVAADARAQEADDWAAFCAQIKARPPSTHGLPDHKIGPPDKPPFGWGAGWEATAVSCTHPDGIVTTDTSGAAYCRCGAVRRWGLTDWGPTQLPPPSPTTSTPGAASGMRQLEEHVRSLAGRVVLIQRAMERAAEASVEAGIQQMAFADGARVTALEMRTAAMEARVQPLFDEIAAAEGEFQLAMGERDARVATLAIRVARIDSEHAQTAKEVADHDLVLDGLIDREGRWAKDTMSLATRIDAQSEVLVLLSERVDRIQSRPPGVADEAIEAAMVLRDRLTEAERTAATMRATIDELEHEVDVEQRARCVLAGELADVMEALTRIGVPAHRSLAFRLGWLERAAAGGGS